MALFNVIKWDAPANAVAYKFPGDKLKLGSQIFVSESQSCILLRSGKLPYYRHLFFVPLPHRSPGILDNLTIFSELSLTNIIPQFII